MRRLILIATLVLALAATLAACGSSSEDEATAAATTTPAATASASGGTSASADGAAIWADKCSGCHGQDPSQMAGQETAEVRDAVENGRGGEMPGFSGQLSADEIDAVTQYATGASQ